jgi:DNA-binding MarR family transcriptional regulator
MRRAGLAVLDGATGDLPRRLVDRLDDQELTVVVDEQHTRGGERTGPPIGFHVLQYAAPSYMLANRQLTQGVTVADIDAEDVARLRIALARITRVLDRQSRGHTITGTQASVLATAARLGPLRITELSEFEGINPTMMSRIVGKLEDAGLLHRRADPDDRRAALVEPTTAGRELQRHVREERTRLLAEHLTALPACHTDGLLDALPHLEALATALLTAQPQKDPA